MQLNQLFAYTVVLILGFGGCGPNVKEQADPESWMQGWFSLRHPSDDLIEVSDTQVLLEEGGTAVFRGVEECGSFESSWTMDWEAVDGSTVRIVEDGVLDINPFGFDRIFVLRKLEGCDEFELFRFVEGSEDEVSVGKMHAGQICLSRGAEDEDCIGSGCVVCNKNWCEGEEPPVACDEDAG